MATTLRLSFDLAFPQEALSGHHAPAHLLIETWMGPYARKLSLLHFFFQTHHKDGRVILNHHILE